MTIETPTNEKRRPYATRANTADFRVVARDSGYKTGSVLYLLIAVSAFREYKGEDTHGRDHERLNALAPGRRLLDHLRGMDEQVYLLRLL